MIRKRGITTISLLIIGILLIAGGLSYTAYTYSLSPQDPTQSVESVDSTKTEDISNSNEDSEVTRKVGMAITTFNVGERGWVKSPISGGVFVFHDKKCAHEFTEIHSSYH